MEAVGEFLRAYSTLFGGIGISCLLALSIWVTLYAGQLTLGNAAFAGIAAYSSALLTMKAGFPFPVALASGALLAAIVSLPLGATVFRLRGVYLAIATLAFGEMVRIVILALPITGRGQGLNGIPPKTELWMRFMGTWFNGAINEDIVWYKVYSSERQSNSSRRLSWKLPLTTLTRCTISLEPR